MHPLASAATRAIDRGIHVFEAVTEGDDVSRTVDVLPFIVLCSRMQASTDDITPKLDVIPNIKGRGAPTVPISDLAYARMHHSTNHSCRGTAPCVGCVGPRALQTSYSMHYWSHAPGELFRVTAVRRMLGTPQAPKVSRVLLVTNVRHNAAFDAYCDSGDRVKVGVRQPRRSWILLYPPKAMSRPDRPGRVEVPVWGPTKPFAPCTKTAGAKRAVFGVPYPDLLPRSPHRIWIAHVLLALSRHFSIPPLQVTDDTVEIF